MPGAGCVCHQVSNSIKKALSETEVDILVKNIKAYCAHFHRSHKAWKRLSEIALRFPSLKLRKAPSAAETRWAGIIPLVEWVNEFQAILILYDQEPARDCAKFADGSDYAEYRIHDWDDVAELVRSLHYYISAADHLLDINFKTTK